MATGYLPCNDQPVNENFSLTYSTDVQSASFSKMLPPQIESQNCSKSLKTLFNSNSLCLTLNCECDLFAKLYVTFQFNLFIGLD